MLASWYNPGMTRKLRFSDQLRREVERSEMSRYRIGKRTGIASSILSRFVNQGVGVSMANIDKLFDCLDLEITVRKPAKRKGKPRIVLFHLPLA